MDEDNKLNLTKREEQFQTIEKQDKKNHSHDKSSLFSKTYFGNDGLKNPFKNDIKSKTRDDLNLLSNKSNFINNQEVQIIPEFNENKKISYFTMRNNFISLKQKNKKLKYNFTPTNKEFYLTASVNPLLIKKNEIEKSISSKNLNSNGYKNNNIIDLIHEKEIKVCLDLIKTLPENQKRKIKNKRNTDLKTEERNNLIKIIKRFNIDNRNQQRILENQILNNTIFNSKFNPLSTLSVSMSTNYKTNNIPVNKIIYNYNQSNSTNSKIFNNSSISLKKNSNITKNINESKSLNNNSSFINNKSARNINIIPHTKPNKAIISRNNNSNLKGSHSMFTKMLYDPRHEINFHTGFVRAQKNIYDDVYSKYLKSNKNEIRAENYRKKKKEANKLSLPEIEEYKSIIREIENQKSKILRRSNSLVDIKKEKRDNDLKDQLMEKFYKLYKGQRNNFLNSIKDDYEDSEKIKIDLNKIKKNENIRNINKIKRNINSFVDGYSLFDGKINKKLNEYNYILGNRFHDKEQKNEKVNKLQEIYNEFDNKINTNKNELLNIKNTYDEMFKHKLNFEKDKNTNNNNFEEVNFDKNNYNIYILNGNIILSSNINKIKKPEIISRNNKRDKIYNEYLSFKSEYKEKHSMD